MEKIAQESGQLLHDMTPRFYRTVDKTSVPILVLTPDNRLASAAIKGGFRVEI